MEKFPAKQRICVSRNYRSRLEIDALNETFLRFRENTRAVPGELLTTEFLKRIVSCGQRKRWAASRFLSTLRGHSGRPTLYVRGTDWASIAAIRTCLVAILWRPMPVVTLGPVITGELKSKVDRVWDAFWSGGISNPLEVIEQITYLLFIRRLDDLQTLAEKKARRTGGAIEDPSFCPARQHLRWSRFKNDEPDGDVQDRRRRGVPVPARHRSAATAPPTPST